MYLTTDANSSQYEQKDDLLLLNMRLSKYSIPGMTTVGINKSLSGDSTDVMLVNLQQSIMDVLSRISSDLSLKSIDIDKQVIVINDSGTSELKEVSYAD